MVKAYFKVFFLFISALHLCFASSASAQNRDVAEVASESRSSIARILVEFRKSDGEDWGKSFEGTAFFVSEQGHLLTAAHLVRGDDGHGSLPSREYLRSISIFPAGSLTSFRADLIDEGQDDVALVQVRDYRGSRSLPIAQSGAVEEGDELVFAGFPGGEWTHNVARITNLSSRGLWLAELTTSFGASGAPILDRCGRVLGIVVGAPSDDRRGQARILPERRFWSVVDGYTIRESSPCRVPGVLSPAQQRDLCRLLQSAAHDLRKYRGLWIRRLSSIGREYEQTGTIIWYGERHRTQGSRLGNSERSAVADAYQATIATVIEQFEGNRRAYAQMARELIRAAPSRCRG